MPRHPYQSVSAMEQPLLIDSNSTNSPDTSMLSADATTPAPKKKEKGENNS